MRPLAPRSKIDCAVMGELNPVPVSNLVSKATVLLGKESSRAI